MLENHMAGKSGSSTYKLECFLHLVDYALINGLQEEMEIKTGENVSSFEVLDILVHESTHAD